MIHAKIAAALAMPHTHCVLTVFASGEVRAFTTRCAGSAETHAIGDRRRIGRDLIRRETGATVRMIAVYVEPIRDRAALAAEYVDLIGYDPFDDDASADPWTVAATLAEYRAIAAAARSNP